jgi:hypothetical protein
MSFFSSKNKQTYTLVISFKSSSIDFQLISSIAGDASKKEVLLVERDILLLESSQDPEIYISQCMNELSSLFQKNQLKIQKITQGAPVKIQIILYAPWFTSKITPVTNEEPVVIDEAFLLKKLVHIQEDKNLHVLEKRIIKIQSNGYTLNDFLKTKCSNLYLNVYSSYISNHIHELFMKVIQKFLPQSKEISYITSPILILDSIKRFLIKEDNVTFLYIGGEITEVGIIEDDSLSHFATFPIGKHDFLREIQLNLKTYDYDVLYGKQIQIKSKKQQDSFDKLKQKWANFILQSLESFSKNVPSKILIITDTKTKDFFTEILLKEIQENPQSVLKNNRIINFDISLLKDIISYKTPFGESELDLKLEALI